MTNTTTSFKKNQAVKFAIKLATGTVTRGKGTVTALVPKDTVKGACRLTVKDTKGNLWRPFPSQCKAA